MAINSAEKIDNIYKPFTVIRERQRSSPVDVASLAADFGMEILYKDWSDNLSGAIGKDEKGFFIIVNKNHPAVRQRFTIAHEIAHFVLHHDQIGSGIRDDWRYRSRISDADERAANKLAAEILMPANLLSQVAAEVVGVSGIHAGAGVSPKYIDDIARKLDVSTTALAIRLCMPV